MHAQAIRTLTAWLSAAFLLAGTLLHGHARQEGHRKDPATQLLDWRMPLTIAAGNGERGPWQQNDSRYDYVDDPTVALDERGGVALAWVEQRNKDVFFQALMPGKDRPAAPPVNVSRSPATFSWLPRIALSPHGAADRTPQIFVLWQEIIFSGGSHGGDILFARSQDGGRTFSAPLNLSHSIGGDGKGRINKDVWHNGSFDLAIADDGTLYAAWTEYDGQLWLSRSRDQGASFSPAQQIARDSSKPARAPTLATGPHQTLYLAWTTGEDDAADIHIARSRDRGATFGIVQRVAPSPAYSDAPKLAVDTAGVLHLVYAESAAGPFSRARILYTRATKETLAFEVPRVLSAPGTFRTGAAFPALSLDAKGRVFVLWEWLDDSRQRSRGLGMAISQDSGRSFTAPADVPHSADAQGGVNGSLQGLLMDKLAVNEGGLVAVVNSAIKQDQFSRIWLMRAQAR